MTDYLHEAFDLFEYTQGLRRDFHQHPEIGFQEVRTAGIVARELNALGLEVIKGVGKTGVVAVLEGKQPGPTALLRFDMDALPIQEETGAEYASLNPGLMHACGHDGHTAIGLTVARILQSHRDELAGTVKFIFQPAEEGLGGAEAMIADGILEDPKPDISLALHLWNEKPLGWIGAASGPVMAAAEIFSIRVIGKGGHGAVPQLAIDPVLAAAQIITAVQSIVSRNVSPLQSAVISITTMRSGEAFNVIPPEVELQGTIRTFDPEVRQRILERFTQVATGVGEALGCQVEVNIKSITSAVSNNSELAMRFQKTIAQLLPESKLITDYRTMGSEDMAFIMQEVPGCFFFIGSANSDKGLDAAHHHPRFDFDERALSQGVALMAAVAGEYLGLK